MTENKRAALSPEQAARLVTTTRAGKFRRGMSGEDRSWLYTLAIYTGLRRSELQSLSPESFDLECHTHPSPFPAATPRTATMQSSPFPPTSSRPCGPGWQPSPGRNRSSPKTETQP